VVRVGEEDTYGQELPPGDVRVLGTGSIAQLRGCFARDLQRTFEGEA
jgi:hypothetical protein